MIKIRKYKAMRIKDKTFVEGYFWKSPKDEFNKSFIIETYIKSFPTSTCNAKIGTRSVEIDVNSLEELNGN